MTLNRYLRSRILSQRNRATLSIMKKRHYEYKATEEVGLHFAFIHFLLNFLLFPVLILDDFV